MRPTMNIRGIALGLALVWAAAGSAFATDLPLEPGEGALMREDVNIVTGFYIREYSLAGDGLVDYRTARQILLSEHNQYWNTVVQAREFPLFYWYDADKDGHFEMWVDRKVEGCPCDIVPYHVLKVQ